MKCEEFAARVWEIDIDCLTDEFSRQTLLAHSQICFSCRQLLQEERTISACLWELGEELAVTTSYRLEPNPRHLAQEYFTPQTPARPTWNKKILGYLEKASLTKSFRQTFSELFALHKLTFVGSAMAVAFLCAIAFFPAFNNKRIDAPDDLVVLPAYRLTLDRYLINNTSEQPEMVATQKYSCDSLNNQYLQLRNQELDFVGYSLEKAEQTDAYSSGNPSASHHTLSASALGQSANRRARLPEPVVIAKNIPTQNTYPGGCGTDKPKEIKEQLVDSLTSTNTTHQGQIVESDPEKGKVVAPETVNPTKPLLPRPQNAKLESPKNVPSHDTNNTMLPSPGSVRVEQKKDDEMLSMRGQRQPKREI